MAWAGSMLLDGSIEEWALGVPVNQNIQITNTALAQLTRLMVPRLHPAASVFHNITGVKEPLVKDGQNALRATIAAAGVADNFRIWSPGAIIANLTGVTTNPLFFDSYQRYYFSFWARGSTKGNALRVRIFARSAANAILGGFGGEYATAAATVVGIGRGSAQFIDGLTVVDYMTVELNPFWRKYGWAFDIPRHEPTGSVMVDHLVWQISNDTAGAQVIDLDDIQFGEVGEQEAYYGR